MSSTFPLVTVGIPTYNRPEGLRKTLECITRQTYTNLEIIVSDNGSPTDEPSKVVDEFKLKDSRIVFFQQPVNKGQKFNFFFVLEKARGDYFMWAADDDWWAPEFVEKIMALLVREPEAIAGFTDFVEMDTNGERVKGYPDHLPLLQEFILSDKVRRAKSFIRQYEGFGKANLIYSIFRMTVLRAPGALNLLNSGYLPADNWFGLSFLLNGRLVIVPEVLRKCTVGNLKGYHGDIAEDKVIDLGVIRVHWSRFKQIYAKWGRYLYKYVEIVSKSNLRFSEKISIFPVIIWRILLFYYDLVCGTFQLKGFNLFYKLKRKHTLE